MLSEEFIVYSITIGILVILVATFWGIGKYFNNNINRMYSVLLKVSLIFMLLTLPMGIIELVITGKGLNSYTIYILGILIFLGFVYLNLGTQEINEKVYGSNANLELFIIMCIVSVSAVGLYCIYKFLMQYLLLNNK